MIDALAPLSSKIFTCVFLQHTPFCFGLTFLEFLTFDIKTTKVIGTRSV